MESRMSLAPLYSRLEELTGSAAEERDRFETLLSYVAGRDLDHSIMVKFCPQLTLQIREAWEPEYDYDMGDEHVPCSFNRMLRWHYSSLDGHKAGELRIDMTVNEQDYETYLEIAMRNPRSLNAEQRERRKSYDMEFLSAIEFVLGLQEIPYAKWTINGYTEWSNVLKQNVPICRSMFRFGLDVSRL